MAEIQRQVQEVERVHLVSIRQIAVFLLFLYHLQMTSEFICLLVCLFPLQYGFSLQQTLYSLMIPQYLQ